jgi:predicted nucleic acid-binding protein
MAQAGSLTIDIPDHIEKELVRVLREDFQWEGYRLHFTMDRLRQLTRRVTPITRVQIVNDPDDDRIIECALAAGSEYILTNDKALLRVGNYLGILIAKPDEFLAEARDR